VDVRSHQVPNGLIDEAMNGYPTQALQGLGSQADAEVTAAIPRAGVAAVEVAFVDHLQVGGGEGTFDAEPDPRNAVSSHGKT
jgi:hypothetical protein